MKVVYLVDGMYESHKCFAAYRELATKAGAGTGVTYGVLRGLASYRKTFGPGHIVMCWEGKPKRRIAADANYKADRAPQDSAFYAQVESLKKALQELGVEQLYAPEWEADDVLASLAIDYATKGYKVVIVTGDDDLLQMVRDEGDTGPIVVYNPKGKATFNVAAVVAKYGAKPEDLIYQWAVEGDASDNIPPATSDRSLRAQLRDSHKAGNYDIKSVTIDPEVVGRFDKNIELLRLQVDVDSITPILMANIPNETGLKNLFQSLEFNSFLKPEAFPKWLSFASERG